MLKESSQQGGVLKDLFLELPPSLSLTPLCVSLVFVFDHLSWFATHLLHPGAPRATCFFHPQTTTRWMCPAVSAAAALALYSETGTALRGPENSLSTVRRAALLSPTSALHGPVTHHGRWGDKHKDSLMLFSFI